MKKTIFFLIDSSKSIGDLGVSSINENMCEIIDFLKDHKAQNSGFEVDISVIVFSDNAHRMGDAEITEIDDFYWDDISTGKTSEFGKALSLLEESLSTKQFENPYFIYVGDGRPTDKYQNVFDKIKLNPCYLKGVKIAMTLGEMVDKQMLYAFTEQYANIISINDFTALEGLIK